MTRLPQGATLFLVMHAQLNPFGYFCYFLHNMASAKSKLKYLLLLFKKLLIPSEIIHGAENEDEERVAERQKNFRKFCSGLFFHTFKLYTKSLLIFVFFFFWVTF